jgi:hypothetical protein
MEQSKLMTEMSHAVLLTGLPLALILLQPMPVPASPTADQIASGKTEQGYPFVSGGVGIEERQQMLHQAKRYDLELAFADHTGKYLSNVDIVINDQHGRQIVNTISSGPWFYISLPAGKYDVKATFDNRTEEIKNLDVSKDHHLTRLLHWDVTQHEMNPSQRG